MKCLKRSVSAAYGGIHDALPFAESCDVMEAEQVSKVFWEVKPPLMQWCDACEAMVDVSTLCAERGMRSLMLYGME